MRMPEAIMEDPSLRRVLAALAPHRALVVGGAVRNALLGQPVEDIDIATVRVNYRFGGLAAARY